MVKQANDAHITIEVAYAFPDKQFLQSVRVASGTSVRMSLALTDLPRRFPELDIDTCSVGIFGKQVEGSRVLKAGDRVEIYRALPNDPREMRRLRAAAEQTTGRKD
jgi:putative ubiquitin-RnfH superfamily antitoxin RatB of RatAB toxin-antitoxin module